MNTYQISSVADSDRTKRVSEPVVLEARSPWAAYRAYVSTKDQEFTILQDDDIGSDDNPCTRFISRNDETKEKFFFYVTRQPKDN